MKYHVGTSKSQSFSVNRSSFRAACFHELLQQPSPPEPSFPRPLPSTTKSCPPYLPGVRSIQAHLCLSLPPNPQSEVPPLPSWTSKKPSDWVTLTPSGTSSSQIQGDCFQARNLVMSSPSTPFSASFCSQDGDPSFLLPLVSIQASPLSSPPPSPGMLLTFDLGASSRSLPLPCTLAHSVHEEFPPGHRQ